MSAVRKLSVIVLCTFNALHLFSQSDTSQVTSHANWGVGMEFGPCTGWFFNTRQADQLIQDGPCYANVGFTFSWKKFQSTFHLGGIAGSLKEDLTYGSGWIKGNRLGSSHLHLSAGYELINNRFINVVPFVNGGLTVFSTDPDSVSAALVNTSWLPSYSAGAILDFKWNAPLLPKNRDTNFKPDGSYLFLRLITGVYPTYFQNPLRIAGSMYYFSLNIGFYLKALTK